jgi:uncharacterized RDD family membrane protein YckC
MSTHDPGPPSDDHSPPPSSPFGGPPPPYGQPYGQPDPQPYGQPYAQPYQPGYAAPVPYASWGVRLGAYLLDTVLALVVVLVPAVIGGILFASGTTTTTDAYGSSTTEFDGPAAAIGICLFVVAFVLGIAFQIWNLAYRQGRTTQSLGKKWLGIAVVKEDTGRPIGFGAGFGRLLMHGYVDTLFGMCLPLGFLWPLWDPRKRTWGDMAVGSIVIRTSGRS